MKSYLDTYLQSAEKPKHQKSELTKPPKPSSVSYVSDEKEDVDSLNKGSVSFVSSENKDIPESKVGSDEKIHSANISQNATDKTDETPKNCPHCTAGLASDDSAELIIRFCPFGCSFVYRAFNDYRAAVNLTAVMLAELPENERKTMYDSLDARRVALMKTGLDFYEANLKAESDLFPCWLDDYKLKNRIGTIANHKKETLC